MIGRIQCRSSSNNTGANNYSRNANNNRTLPVKNTKCQDTFQKAKTNSRRRRAEISSIKRGERHLLIDGEVRPHNIRKQSRKKRDAKMRKKKTRNRNGGDTETPLTSYRDDTQINCNNTEEYNCDIDMSDHSSGGQFPIKKRGHQHHPRFAGQRRSNVPAEEVLAALRRGGVIEMSKVLTADILVDPPPPPPLEGQHNQHVTSGGERESHDSDADNVICQTLRNTVIDNSDDCEDFNRNVIGCVTTEQLLVCDEENNAISRTATSALPDEPVTTTNSCDTSLPSSFSTEVLATKPKNDDIYLSQQPKTKSNKSKNRDKQKDGKSSKSDEKKKRRQQKENQNPGDIPRYERSEGDGAPNDGAENDPETEEWSRLRCTSERTEVIAEREHRRRKKCADYPGLAFGRSIFSSDTMMKFNIIRNELHNIMKTQLKRRPLFKWVAHRFSLSIFD